MFFSLSGFVILLYFLCIFSKIEYGTGELFYYFIFDLESEDISMSVSNYLPEWKQVFQTKESEGFHVTDAVRTGVGTPVHSVLFHLDTPYQLKDGRPVYGVGSVSASRPKNARDLEFWVEDETGTLRNLDDVTARMGQTFDLYQNGSWVNSDDAREDVGAYLLAASEYPHVALYEEFAEVQRINNQRFGFGEPTPEDYNRYLDTVQKNMLSGDVQYIGKMTRPKDLFLARASCPETAAEADITKAMSELELD